MWRLWSWSGRLIFRCENIGVHSEVQGGALWHHPIALEAHVEVQQDVESKDQGLLAHTTHLSPLPQVISLRSTSDAVRAAAIDCCAELAAGGFGAGAGAEGGHLLSLAAQSPGLLGGLIDAWEAITDGLTDESDVVCAAACAAVAALLRRARAEGGGGLVMQNLVQVRGQGALSVFFSRSFSHSWAMGEGSGLVMRNLVQVPGEAFFSPKCGVGLFSPL